MIDRTVCDTNGSHVEKAWFHKSCALQAAEQIALSLKAGPVPVWSN